MLKKKQARFCMNYRIFLPLMVLLLKTVLLAGLNNTETDEAMNVDLKTALEYAIQHNYDVLNSQLDIQAAQKQLREVAAGGLPQINGSVDFNDFLDIPTQLIPGEIFGGEPGSTIKVKFGRQYIATWSLSGSQLIFSGSFLVGLQASKIYLKLMEQNLKRSQLEVAELVTQTYYLVLVAEENLRILEESQKNLEKTHYEIQEFFKEGFVEETDVKQIQISVTQLKNTVNTVRQQIGVTYKLLKFQMGIELEKKITLTENLDKIVDKVDIPSLLKQEFVLEENINYRLFSSQITLSKLNLRNEKMKFLPTISGFATYQQTAQRNRFDLFDRGKDWFPTTVVGLSIKIPIFTSGSRVYRMQQAQIAIKQAQINQKKIEQGLRLEYEQAKTGLTSSFENYKNAKENVNLAKEVYEVTLEKYREGLSSSTDLVQIHNQYLTAQSGYITAKSELLNAKNKMDKLLENY
jgi:outer membrane protein